MRIDGLNTLGKSLSIVDLGLMSGEAQPEWKSSAAPVHSQDSGKGFPEVNTHIEGQKGIA